MDENDILECCDEICADKPTAWWTFLIFFWVLS